MATNLLLSQQIAFLLKSSYKRFQRLVGRKKASKALCVHLLVATSFFPQVYKTWEEKRGGEQGGCYHRLKAAAAGVE